jgi:hypothetical protein
MFLLVTVGNLFGASLFFICIASLCALVGCNPAHHEESAFALSPIVSAVPVRVLLERSLTGLEPSKHRLKSAHDRMPPTRRAATPAASPPGTVQIISAEELRAFSLQRLEGATDEHDFLAAHTSLVVAMAGAKFTAAEETEMVSILARRTLANSRF